MPLVRSLLLISVTLALAACATTRDFSPSDPLASARDLPERFVPRDGVELSGTGACVSPLRDPRDGTALVLARSGTGLGDYRAPSGRYGNRSDQLVRVDCASGRPLGLRDES